MELLSLERYHFLLVDDLEGNNNFFVTIKSSSTACGGEDRHAEVNRRLEFSMVSHWINVNSNNILKRKTSCSMITPIIPAMQVIVFLTLTYFNCCS